MKGTAIRFGIAVLALCGLISNLEAGETSLAAYASYWDADSEEAIGGGIKLRKKFLGFLSADIRGGYVDFNDVDADLSVIPLEATFMVGIPFLLEPYAGIGGGYYLVDTDYDPLDENITGYYGVLGLQFNLFVVGAFAELRYQDLEGTFFDGPTANLGLMVKW